MSRDAYRRLVLVVSCTALIAALATLGVLFSWWIFWLSLALGPSTALALTIEEQPRAELEPPSPAELEGMSRVQLNRLHREASGE